MRLRVLSLALFVAVAMTVAPTAAPRTSAASVTNVTVTMKEFKFVLSKRTVVHGTVVFKLVNKGRLPHNMKISGKKSVLVKPGKTAFLRVVLSKGSKPYVCALPGHAAAGMKGILRVT